ncbi:MAG: chloride channel protein [Gemmatimonadetes bacterium]|nr:chloride channel protein [Gemmatimonadota bacterium]
MTPTDIIDEPLASAPVATHEPRLRLSTESVWYAEHAALLVSTAKWAVLGAACGGLVGLATRAFLGTLAWSGAWATAHMPPNVPTYAFLPFALAACVFLIRRFAPEAEGHGTEAVIAAVHQSAGRIDWRIAPVKLVATALTLAFGGSVGKEGPAAQIGGALTSGGADLIGLAPADRRRLVICGISAGFAAVFGTPISGALFGVEVLYLGQLEYAVLFPAMVSGIVAHLVCGTVPPLPVLQESLQGMPGGRALLLAIGSGAVFGLVALAIIEAMRAVERVVEPYRRSPYSTALLGGVALVLLYLVAGDGFAGLGSAGIADALVGTADAPWWTFAVKIIATAITLEVGGSGGVITPIFFIGATSGAALGHLLGVSPHLLAAFGLVAVLAACANTPVAAAVMAIELLPGGDGVYAALAAATAFILVGHRSVYASQKLGLAKSAGLEIDLGGTMGDVRPHALRLREGSLVHRVLRRPRGGDAGEP